MPGTSHSIRSIRQRLALWLCLVCTLLTTGAYLLATKPDLLQTNLLALLPATERNPVAESAITQLASVTENQAVFLIAGNTPDNAIRSAQAFTRTLEQSDAFAKITLHIDAANIGHMQQWLHTHRFQLITAEDQRQLLDNAHSSSWLLQQLQSRLFSPVPQSLPLSFESDPLGTLNNWVQQLPLKTLKLQPESGVLLTREAQTTWVFVHAALQGSAYDHSLARRVVAAVELAHSRSQAPHVIRAGAVFHAESAHQQAQRDVDLIGIGSLIGILLLLYWAFRSTKPLLGSLVSIFLGITAACIACVLVYGNIHLLTLVFGASLIGEAVDYAIQYFAAHVDAADQWDALGELQRMQSGLAVALATSLLGYAALWFSPFTALSQIALFAMVGLLTAWLCVFLFLPWLLRKPVRSSRRHNTRFQRQWLHFWNTHMSPQRCLLLAGAVVLIAATGWPQLQGRDDIRLLTQPNRELTRQDQQFKTLTGLDPANQFFLIEADSPDAVLAREEVLRTALHAAIANGDLRAYQATSLFIPSASHQRQSLAIWHQLLTGPQATLVSSLTQLGLKTDVTAHIARQASTQQTTPLHVDTWLRHPASAPWRHLWMGRTANGYASIVLPLGLHNANAMPALASGMPGVSWVDKAAGVSQLFQQYRHYSAFWLVFAIGLIGCVVCWRYGWRQGCATLLPTILAIVFSLGIYGWFGQPLTLFNMMALMLVLGIGVNYAIFLVEGGAKNATTLLGVQLSAITTLLSFGLLSLSSMPVLSGFGLNLTLGITCAVALAPMALSLSPQRPHSDSA